MPISGTSAISRATVREATPLIERKASSRRAHKRIVVDQRGDLALEAALLALEQDDDLIEAGDGLGVGCGGPALLVDGEVARHLGKPGNQSLEPLLGGARRRRRADPLDLGVMGDDAGIDVVGLLQEAHRLGKAAHVARIDQGAGLTLLPQQQEGQPLVAATRLHDDQLDAMVTTEGVEFGDTRRVVAEAPDAPAGPTWASSQAFETSTPQMIVFTVTCLVRAIGTKRLFGRA